jgi:hypothetical protein
MATRKKAKAAAACSGFDAVIDYCFLEAKALYPCLHASKI